MSSPPLDVKNSSTIFESTSLVFTKNIKRNTIALYTVCIENTVGNITRKYNWKKRTKYIICSGVELSKKRSCNKITNGI